MNEYSKFQFLAPLVQGIIYPIDGYFLNSGSENVLKTGSDSSVTPKQQTCLEISYLAAFLLPCDGRVLKTSGLFPWKVRGHRAPVLASAFHLPVILSCPNELKRAEPTGCAAAVVERDTTAVSGNEVAGRCPSFPRPASVSCPRGVA